ncbi:hypothetical protein BDN72DRAFT_888467 [Pluteus cervinus]|uniref:Uncharacterized protein n=1 Tax=Pluteus cervinus TaxID=181527 RepID=A0ACD3ASQ7_9AGAR|nr:hypothetical protein BDN72DRAFT_888467 [Pluteus cervinus]
MATGIAFPSTESRLVQPMPQIRPPHLPFRRISLPTAPSLAHRQSVVSVASFDSLPEEGGSPPNPSSSMVHLSRTAAPTKRSKSKGPPSIVESPRKGQRRRESIRPLDESRSRKRRKIVVEFYETERSYVDGLDLIYSHFLTPIIQSLDTPNPLLDRTALTSVFSNFIDIWNLHRAFLTSLTNLLAPHGIPSSPEEMSIRIDTPSLSPVLLSHFPYLSLYKPFVTSFPSTISALSDLVTLPTATRPNPHYSQAFASFLATHEADPRCAKLKLRDWLLSIVQRCPRYLLLLKDLIQCLDSDDPEHAQLTAVHTLVSKITVSLNTNLHSHAQTLALLALQRSTPNLPFQLISPGRSLLKRGPLLHLEKSSQPRPREFLLFSDCLIWLASEEDERSWNISSWVVGYGSNNNSVEANLHLSTSPSRGRSKSDADDLAIEEEDGPSLSPVRPQSRVMNPSRRVYHHPAPNAVQRRASAGSSDDRFIYKGRVELVDLEVVITAAREPGEERRFEILSPEGSFALYTANEEERDEWSKAIRQAKAQWMMSLNVTNPNSTLTSSASTNHLRRSLQALPFPPNDERIATLRPSKPGKQKSGHSIKERRGKVEHWVPAIWIPDEKTGGCMRCGKSFGWRRRRHHCRLCGRCVCASCSGRTFFISDSAAKDKGPTPARACDACYETVFPLIESPKSEQFLPQKQDLDTLTSLHNIPTHLSMPVLPTSPPPLQPQALMAIDRMSSGQNHKSNGSSSELKDGEETPEGRGPIRFKSTSRPRSYYQILEDFEVHERTKSEQELAGDERDVVTIDEEVEGVDGDEGQEIGFEDEEQFAIPRTPVRRARFDDEHLPSPRREDTARRVKRFSLPAVALQTMSVTAQTQVGELEGGREGGGVGGRSPAGSPLGASKFKRFSLVLGTRGHYHQQHQTQATSLGTGNSSTDLLSEGEPKSPKGVAATKLMELLGRKRT